jgi:hypothetical protein
MVVFSRFLGLDFRFLDEFWYILRIFRVFRKKSAESGGYFYAFGDIFAIFWTFPQILDSFAQGFPPG